MGGLHASRTHGEGLAGSTRRRTALERRVSVVKPPLADGVEGEREKLEPSASVELVLELDPAREGRAIGH